MIWWPKIWDHPRVRGEKSRITSYVKDTMGSPPRARGKAGEKLQNAGDKRITPACAGKRADEIPGKVPGKDHPRVRGEKDSPTSLSQ